MLLLDQASEIKTFLTPTLALKWSLAVAFLAAIIVTCLLPRDNWPILLVPFSIGFAVYAIILTNGELRSHLRFWLAIAIIARVILLFTFPNLSDDIYRFFWDGHANLQGLNTYAIIPSEFLAVSGESGALSYDLLSRMNSPDYYTVYPPPLQLIFTIGAAICGAGIYPFSIILKLFILGAELGTILLLTLHFSRSGRSTRVLIYALNPLVVIELMGNLHFEAIMIFGLILAVTTLASATTRLFKRFIGIVAGLFIAIGAKLLPIISLPFLLRRMNLKSFMALCFSLLVLLVGTFSPLLSGKSLNGMASSLNLYFQTFEFNASFYYLFRWIGYQWKGYNMIETLGPFCAATTIIILAGILILERKPDKSNWAVTLLFAFTTYLLFSSIVHPWYICSLVALSAFTSYRYALVWSGLIFLSYATYQTDEYIENYWLTAIEYIVVIGVLIYELYDNRRVSGG